MPSGRSERVNLNYGHLLAQELVFAGLGELPNAAYFHDSSLYNNHRTLTNMAIPATATSGWAWNNFLGRWLLWFDGSNDYVEMPAGILTGATTWTISFWIHNTSSTSNASPFGDLLGGAWAFPTMRRSSGGKWQIYAKDGGTIYINAVVTAGAPLTTLEHMVICYDAASCLVYRSGLLTDTLVATDARTQTVGADVRLGGGQNASVVSWSGGIGDFMVWKRLLSNHEIADLANPSNVMLSGLILPPRRRLWTIAAGATPNRRRRTLLCGSPR